ncbi:MAG: HYR domain-containing protein [Saprospiraceae bacterium]
MNSHLPSLQLKNFNALSLILAFLLCTGFTFANGYHAASPKPAAAQLQYVLDHAVDGQMIVLPAVVEDVLTIRSGVSLLTSGTSLVKGIVMDAPGKTVKLLGNLKVEGTLEFKGGIMDAGEYKLDSKEILGIDHENYLIMTPPPPPGSLTISVPTSGNVVFPIGTNSGFTPVTVSATANHTTDDMTASVVDKMNLADFTAPTPVGPAFAEFEWNVSETVNGGSEVNLKMEFPTDPHNLKNSAAVLGHNIGGNWSSKSTVVSGSGPYTTNNTGLYTSFSPFGIFGMMPVHNLTQGMDYGTIQAAIDAAVANDVILCDAGSYTENINIHTPITLRGPNVGIPGIGVRMPEAILLNCTIDVNNAGNTTLDGLHILRNDGALGPVNQIELDGGGINTVQNCIFERNGSNAGQEIRAIATTTAGGNKIIANNKIFGDPSGGLFGGHKSWARGIYIDQGPFTVSFTGNTVLNCRSGMNIDDMNNNVTVSGNTINNNGTHISFGGAVPTTGSFVLGANDFINNIASGMINLSNVAASFRLDITSSTLAGVAFNALTNAQLFDVEARMLHKEVLASNKGKVVYVANTQYVNNFTMPITKIDQIQNSVNYAEVGNIINLQSGTYTQRVVIDKGLTLQGLDSATCILNGTGLGTGSGISINGGVTNVSIKEMRIQNFTGTSGNSTAAIFATSSNNDLTIHRVTVQNNPSNHGIFGGALSGINNVSVTNSRVINHGPGLRGIVLWDGLKTNINITNNLVSNNSCCGIELQDGDASGVTVTGNTVDIGGGDNAIGLTGLNFSVGANLISNNTITGGGRFGIEIKNPSGGVTVSGNNVKLTTLNSDQRDRAGIAVFRRSVFYNNVDIPNGVTVSGNTVEDYRQTAGNGEEGFGIVIEGTNHTVSGNTVNNCDVAIQQQGGLHPFSNYPGDGSTGSGSMPVLSPNYFGRGNSPYACGNVIDNTNIFSANTVNVRNVISSSNYGLVTNTNNGETFCNIQAAINDLETISGHTLNVGVGTFAENIIVSKQLTILGPNANIDPCSATPRVAEAIVVPASAAISSGEIFHVAASNVTIKGFTIDGDNTAITSGFSSTNGADIDAAEGITVYETGINNLTASNNIIKNLSYFGLTLYDYPAGVPSTGHTISNNKIQDLGTYDAGSGINYWGGGVLLYNNQYAAVTNNCMTNVRLGIQTGNFSAANPGSSAFALIDNNTISARRRGIFHNLHYGGTSPYTLSNNTITGVVNANETLWDGILLSSLSVGSTSSANTINGSAISNPSEGYEVWNIKSTSPAVITGGSVSGVNTGIFINNYDGYVSDAVDGAHASISSISITPNVAGTGIRIFDNPLATSNAYVQAIVGAGVVITNGANGLIVENETAQAISPVGNMAFSGQSSDHIKLINNANNIDATAASFNGIPGGSATISQLYTIEDKINHKIDLNSLGFVTVKASNSYVTPNSFTTPNTTPSVQRGIDAVAANGTVHIQSGTTYTGGADASAKTVTLAPGASPSCVTITGNLVLNSGDVLDIEADGTTACTLYDQFIVNGTVTLGGATLNLILGYVPANGDQLKIIDNDLADAVIGQFAQGGTILAGGTLFDINYQGGDGNDVVLTACGAGRVHNGANNYCTIQDAIDGAVNGDIITVDAGTYTENILVNKQVTILGPNANIDPCVGVRGPEAIIVPAIADFDGNSAYSIIDVQASNVTIKGFTIDGDNPAITSGFTSTNGADIDIAVGITRYVTGNNINISNNIVQNLSYFGLELYDYPAAVPSAGNTIEKNQIQNLGSYDGAPGGLPFWGGGILLYNNQYAAVTNNCMTNVRLGIQTGNFSQANPGANTYQSISNNTIQSRRVGVFHNLHYSSASPFTLSTNTLTTLDNSNETGWRGILLGSLQNTASFITNNIVNGTGSTRSVVEGINVWNCQVAPTISGGNITNTKIGINVNNYEGYTSNADPSFATIDGVTVTGATIAGIRVHDNPLNTNGATVFAEIKGNTNVSGSPVGILVLGPDASATVKNNPLSINGNTIGIDVDGGSALIENNHIYDNGIGVRFINSGTGTVKTNKFFETLLPNGKDLQLAANAGSVTATDNNWFSGTTYGVENLSATDVDATLNYWNAANGPGPIGPGSGANITTKVLYCQYLNGIPVPLGGTGAATSPTVTILVTETSGVANNDGIICAGASATLDATTTGATAYSWSTGATTASIIVTPGTTTTYTVTVTFPGCTVTDDQIITVEPLPACTITGTNGPVCPNTSNDFSGPAGVSYAWSISGNATIPGATNAQTVSVLAGSLCNNNFTLTLVTTDGNSCTSSCTKTVNVLDNTEPVITPGTIAACYPTVGAAEAAALAATSATDNCPGSITEAVSTSGTCSAVVTVTETDACGNVSSTAYNTRIDNTPPTFTSCPTTITVNNVVGLCGRSVSYAAPTATDNCTGMLTILKVDGTGLMSGDFFPVGTTLQKFETTDECGNTSTCMFNVIVIDNELPIITGCPSNIVKSTDPGLCTALVTWVAPTASDNCPGVSLSLSPNLPPGSIFPKGVTNMVYTATDASTNFVTCTFTVTVNDNELPQITCPSNIVVNADAGQCSAIVTYTTPVGTDNCPSPMTTQTAGLASGAAFPVGLTTNTFKVTDGSMNMATCSFTVTVNDNQNPVITDCPDDITVSCAADTTIANTGGPAIATDNCPGVVVTVTEVVTNQTCDHRFTLTRTWKATDAKGNTATCTQVVTTNDLTAPTLTGTPYAGTTGTNACLANAAAASPFNAANAIIGYTDNCTGVLTATLTDTDVSGTDCAWTVTYTFTVKDVCGNELTGQTYSNTGSDQTAPSLTGTPYTGTTGTNSCKANAATAAPFNASLAIQGYTDNCLGPVTAVLTNTVVTGTDCNWTVTYTFSVLDECNNALTNRTYSNTGSDQTPPAITCASGSPFTRGTTLGYCGYIVSGTEFNATASDLCGGAVTITNNFNLTNTLANDTLPTGTTTIVWTATDACGNSSSCTIMVTVTDGENPQVFCKIGKGLDFDGVNEYVTVADNAVLEGMGALTVMGWMKIDALPVQNYAPIAKENAYRFIIGANGSFHFVVATNSNGWYSAGTVGSGGSNLLPTNKWIHVAGVYTGSKVNVYVNGVLMGTSTGTISGNIVNNGSPLTMAFKTASNINYFNGKMDEVGVFNQALTAAQIKTYLGTSLLGTEPGLVAYYNLEQGTGTVANDNAGSAQNGTLVNMENVDWMRTPFGPNNSITVNTDPGMCKTALIFDVATIDNCGIISNLNDFNNTGNASGDYLKGTTVVTWTATDAVPNTGTCSFTVIVNDSINPVITICPLIRNIEGCSTAAISSPIFSTTTASSSYIEFSSVPNSGAGTDNCGITSVTYVDVASGTCPIVVTRTWTVLDEAGNSASCNQTINVDDTQAPTITTCAVTRNIEGCNTGAISGPVYSTTPATSSEAEFENGTNQGVASDVCGITSVTYVDVASGTCPIVVTRTWSITDACGNTSTCNQTINVDDTQAPTITTCAVTRNIEGCNTGAISGPVYSTTPAASSEAEFENGTNQGDASDVCGITSVTYVDVANGTCPIVVTRTWSITDACGNTSTCNQTINVDDTQAPMLSCPPTQTQYLDSNCKSLLNDYTSAAIVSDICDPSVTVTQLPAIGTMYMGEQTIVVTLTATDDCSNSSTCSFNVLLEDNTPPTISCPANVTLNAVTGSCEQTHSWTIPTPSDNCGIASLTVSPSNPSVNIINIPPSALALFPVGVTTVTYTATDINGNSTTCSFTVTIVDNQPPIISNCPTNIGPLGNDPGLCGRTVSWNEPTASDNCPGVMLTTTPPNANGSFFPVGVPTLVTYKATDAGGLMTTCSFTVTIIDSEAPQITCPANIVVSNTTGLCSAVVNYTAPIGTDNCPGSVTVLQSGLASGSSFPVGVSTIVYKVTDVPGAMATCSFTVTVNDTELPVISCPSNISVPNDANLCSAVVTYTAPVGTDNCPAPNTVQTAGLASGATFPVGVTTNTFKVTDASGNTATCSFTVTVTDAQAPQITCPSPIVKSNDPGLCSALVTYTAPTGTDNCPGANTIQTAGQASGSYFPVGVTTNTFKVTDAGGLTATCSFTVTVNDTEAPQITCPNNITVSTDAGLCTAVVNYTTPVGTDNCPGVTTARIAGLASGAAFPKGTTNVTYEATDAGGVKASCTFTVTVNDNELPQITCPANIVVSNTVGQCAAVVNYTAPVGTDNCAGANTIQTAGLASGASFPVGVTTNTFKVTDAMGNTATCSFTVTVNDTELPAISCPINISVPNDANLCSAVVTYSAPVGTDNCPGPNTVQTAGLASGSAFPVGVTTNTFKVTDAAGNTATCSFTVTVTDAQGPQITCPANIVKNNDPGLCSALVNYTAPTGTDNCPGANTVQIAGLATASYFPVGVTTNTFKVTDASGNMATCSFTVTVTDTEVPQIVCPGNIIVANDNGNCSAIVNYTAPVGTDNCPGANTVQTAGLASGSAFPVGVTVNTFKVTDGALNTAICSFTITVNDEEAPQITCPANIVTSNTPGLCSKVVTYMAPVGTDNCPGANTTQTAGLPSGAAFPVGVTTNTFQVEDAEGNITTCSFTVTVNDTEAPQITCPNNIVVGNDPGLCSALVTYTAPVGTDNCPGANTIQTAGLASGSYFAVGTTTNTFKVTDAAGNTMTCSFTVTVNDAEAPQISCPNNITVSTDAGLCTTVVNYTAPVGTDNCPGANTIQTAGLASGASFPKGTTTNTFKVTDATGNMMSCSFTVTVNDNELPQITCPANIVVPNTVGQCAAVVNYTAPVGTDNCPGANTIQTAGLASGASFPVGVTNNTFKVTDAMGNTATCSFTVTVNDTELPLITCPSNISVPNDVNQCSAVVTYTAPVGTDNCPGPNTVQTAGLASGAAFPVGVTTNTFKVTDASGNTATCSFTVTVNDTQLPVISCPANIVEDSDPGICSALVTYTAPVGTDNCPNPNTVQTAGQPSGTYFPVGVTTNTFKVTDASGNTATCSFTITVNDIEDPIILNCPETRAIEGCNTGAITSPAYSATLATTTYAIFSGAPNNGDAIENCGITLVQYQDVASGTCPITVTRTWTISDAAGNSDVCTQTITVDDTQNPTINACAVTRNIEGCNTGAISGPAYSETEANSSETEFENATNQGDASDICGIATVKYQDSKSGTCPIVVTRIWKITDACGNQTTCTQTINVDDTQAPTITVCPVTRTIEGCGLGAIDNPPFSMTWATSSYSVYSSAPNNGAANDACGIVTVEYKDVASGECPVVITRTWRLTDACGNSSTCNQTISVDDTQAPSISVCPVTRNINGCSTADITGPVYSATTKVSSYAVFSNATNQGAATDACGINAVTYKDVASGTCPIVVTRTWTVSDVCGNSTTCNQIINVLDVTAPDIEDCAEARDISGCTTADITDPPYSAVRTASTEAVFESSPNWGNVSDTCGIVTVEYKDVAVGSCPMTVTRTWYFKDACGNESSCNQIINVDDNINPTPTCPANITQSNATGVCGATVTFSGSATDNCSGMPVITYSKNSGTFFNVGITTVTMTATDGCGNSATCTFTVTVNDTTKPTVITKPVTLYLNALGTATLLTANVNNGSYDNCAITSLTLSKTSFNCSNIGPNVVTLTAKDAANNMGTNTAVVTILDTIKPNVTCKNITVDLVGGTKTITPIQVRLTATDNCGSPTLSINKSVFTCADPINNNVILTATDASGNTSTCTSVVTIRYKPTCSITLTPATGAYTGGIPNNVYLGYGPQTVLMTCNPTGGSGFTYNWSPTTYLINCTNCQSPTFAPTVPGNFTYTVTVTNSNGCTTTCSVTFCVKDVKVPGSNGGSIYVCHSGVTTPVTIASVPSHVLGHAGDVIGKCDDLCGPPPAFAGHQEEQWNGHDHDHEGGLDNHNYGISELVEPTRYVKVFPNPTSYFFNLFINSDDKSDIEMSVFNSYGKMVEKRFYKNQTDAAEFGENYPDGVYILHLRQGQWTKTMKLVKQNR